MYELLQSLCEQQGITITRLCLQVTGNKGNLATWKKGHMRSDYLSACADILGCSTDYLLGRTNVPEVNYGAVIMPPRIMIHRDNNVELKLVGSAAAGLPLEMIINPPERLSIDSVSADVHLYPTDIVVKIKGDSMIEAAIYDGDYAVIRPCPIAENGQIALVAVDNDCTLKKFYLKSDGVELHPCNKALPIQHYKLSEGIRIIGTYVCTCTGTVID